MKHYLDIEAEFINTLSNNNLTVGCDILVCGPSVHISPSYAQISHISMTNQFEELLETQIGSDFTFDVDKKEFKAHKFMLMACSPLFRAMLANRILKERTNRITVTDVRPEIFKVMLEFIYAGKLEVKLSEHEALELHAVAENYIIKDLKELCLQSFFELLKVENAMKMLSLAEEYDREELVNSIKSFIKANEQEVLNTIDFEFFIKNPERANMFFSKK